MGILAALEPTIVWEIFDNITQIPRPSMHEQRITAWLVEFAKEHELEYKQDNIGNVLIIRPASNGYEQTPRVTLQSHVDMVCEKDSDVQFNFHTDAIRTRVDGDWVKATGTTLGADCGIGMAASLAALIDPTLQRGELEALFTVNEEVGLTGAKQLGKGMINSRYLINLDSEEEGEICIGCAGGVDTVGRFSYRNEATPRDFIFYRIDVLGLTGGHSGEDINRGRANSNKLLARIIWGATKQFEARLCYLDGGNLRNAIPREGYAILGIPLRHIVEFTIYFDSLVEEIKGEFAINDPTLDIAISEMPQIDNTMDEASQMALIGSLMAVTNGVVAMSADMPSLVESSTNLASVKFRDANTVEVATSQRSSRESGKEYVMNSVEATFLLAGAEVSHSEGYPGWSPNPTSELLATLRECYMEQYGAEPVVRAMHAGLECGLFLERYPNVDMVSFGPTMYGVHSPEERLSIESVGRFWELLRRLLLAI